MRLHITENGIPEIEHHIYDTWIPLTIDMVPMLPAVAVGCPLITHIYLDDVNLEQNEHRLRVLWQMEGAKSARVGVVEPDPDWAEEMDQRAETFGLDLSGALISARRWSPVLSRRQRTEASLTGTLERLGTKDVRRVALDDKLLQEEFPVTRRVAWERAYLGRIG